MMWLPLCLTRRKPSRRRALYNFSGPEYRQSTHENLNLYRMNSHKFDFSGLTSFFQFFQAQLYDFFHVARQFGKCHTRSYERLSTQELSRLGPHLPLFR